jgi:CHAD domain-containing protein
MAKVDDSFNLLAGRYIDSQLSKLNSQLKGIRDGDEDVEFVHQGRVASRRLRAGFALFGDCFSKKQLKKWKKCVKSLTKGLGGARDKDVEIAFYEDFLSSIEDPNDHRRAGIERLILRSKQARERLEPAVVRTAGKVFKSGVIEDIGSAAAEKLWLAKTGEVSIKSPNVFQITAEKILSKLDKVLYYHDSITRSNDSAGQHKMRIAAKKLRYTMEICNDVYDKGLKDYIKSAKKLQSLAGDMHDMDVRLAKIDEFVEAEHERTMEYFGYDRQSTELMPGINDLREYCRRKRNELYKELNVCWHKFVSDDTWNELIKLLKGQIESTRECLLSGHHRAHRSKVGKGGFRDDDSNGSSAIKDCDGTKKDAGDDRKFAV